MLTLPSASAEGLSRTDVLEFGLAADRQSVFLELREGSQSQRDLTDVWSVRGVHI